MTAKLIRDAALTLADIPPADADWNEIGRFALTIEGYRRSGSFDTAAKIGNAAAERFAQSRTLPATLSEARVALFFEQRRWRHFGEEPVEADLAYMRALLERIRSGVERKEASVGTRMRVKEDRVEDLLHKADKYHEAYYKAKTFTGPSVYFHRRALETRQTPASLEHLEYVYATLASWGMHRLGSRGSKMCDFDVFRSSVERLKPMIVRAQAFTIQTMDDTAWSVVSDIFAGIKIMASGTTIVGNSKVMHHMLPNVIPPIDRNYTLKYLCGNTNISNSLEKEWVGMRNIISQFFHPVASDSDFAAKADSWMVNRAEYSWDTSVMKIIDNLLIGSRK